jgi:hypothetical protein
MLFSHGAEGLELSPNSTSPLREQRDVIAGAAIDPQDVQGAMQRSGEGHLAPTITCPVYPSRCRADRVRAVAVPAPLHNQQASRVGMPQ